LLDKEKDGVGANKTVTALSKGESTRAIDTFALNNITKNSTVHSDGANGYDNLEAWYNSIKGDHSIAYIC
jgi:hypothetical protein